MLRPIFVALWVFFTLMLTGKPVGAAEPVLPAVEECSSTKEYVTSLEFLRDHKDFKLPEADMRRIASKVAEGCTGAAKRFARVTHTLSKAGLGSKDAVESGMQFAIQSDSSTEAFMTVFRFAFSNDHLDLDLAASIRMAHSLSSEFHGDSEKARKDFEKIVKYCVGAKDLDLPKPQCGSYAARIAGKGELYKNGIAPSFIETFEFARSTKGPGLPTFKAMEMAEEVVAHGPGAKDNFVTGYKYATSKKGLDLPTQEAVAFAREITSVGKARADVPERTLASQKNPSKK